MEKAVEKSGSVKFPKEKGSLDLQSLYNSRSSEEEQNGAKASEVCDLQDGKKKKKSRKNRKSTSLSSFESEAKKRRKDCGNRVMVGSGSRGKTTSDSDFEAEKSTKHCVNSLMVGSGSCGKLTSGCMGFDGLSLTSHENENVLRFPKHQRGSVGPTKIKSDWFSKLSGVSNYVDLGSGSSGRLTIHSKSEAKKGKEDCGNSVKVGSGASGKLTSGSEELDGLSLTSRENEYVFRFPKHPRSSMGPKKFNRDPVFKLSEHSNSVDLVVKINDKVKKAKDDGNPDDQLVNLVKSSVYKVDSSKVKQKTVFDKVKRSRNSGVSSSRHANQENDPASVNNVDTSSKKQRSNNRKRKDLAAHGSGSGSNTKRADPSAGSSVSGSVFIDFQEDNDYDEESLEQNAARMLSSRFDPSCTGYPSNKKSIVSQSTNGFSSLDYSARDLFSRESNSSTHLESASADPESGVLRKEKDQRRKNNLRKRRHFYEILPKGLDAYWVLKRKIKVLRHEDWRSGIVTNYNPVQKLHLVKYDDRFEEWIDLQKEKFKLLLLRSEVPGKGKPEKSSNGDNTGDDDIFVDNIGDTEPIISWLARSGCTKSLPNPLKKQKTMRMLPPMASPSLSDKNDNANKDVAFSEGGRSKLDYEFGVPDNLIVGGRLDDSLVVAPSSSQIRVYVRRRSYEQGERFLLQSIHDEGLVVGETLNDSLVATPSSSQNRVYVRRSSKKQGERFLLRTIRDEGKLRRSDAVVGSELLICLSAVPSFEYSIGTWDLRLSHSVLVLQYGVMVTTSPAVILEMLFVDNVYGLKFFLFEGCLKQAVAFVSLILTVLNQPNERWNDDAELPVTSVSVRVSSVQDLKKRHVFEFYNFSKLKNSEWLYLDSKLLRRCLLIKQLPVSECTYSNITALECGSFKLSKLRVGLELSSVEKNHVRPSMGSRESCQSIYRQAGHPFGNPEDATQQIVEDRMQVASPSVSIQDIHAECNFGTVVTEAPSYGLFSRDKAIASASNVAYKFVSLQDVQNGEPTSIEVTVCTSNSITWASSNPSCDSSFGVTSVEIPSSDQVGTPYDGRRHNSIERSDVGWSMSDGFVHSPNPTLPRSSWHHARYRSSSSPFGNLSPVCSNRKTKSMRNDLSCGLKKPPNQIQYALPFAGCDAKHKTNNQITLPSRRIRKASEKSVSDCPRSSQRNLELEACHANLLVIVGDKSWRERGAQIVLELADRNEWRLAVKLSGITRYSYKVQHNWKAGSSNHYTHGMMWKGGEDWLLEFSDRSEWMLFKELHEECHSRNIRAASVKNIPIPGVRLIEESVDYATEVPFVQNSSKYFHHVQTDVEMAMNPSHVLYDMDSEDEHWLMSKKISSCTDENGFEEISDESFEKMMDKLEKFSYVEHCLHFTLDQIEDLMVGIGSKEVAKAIYEHWRQKRERKGMPLVRQLQPPLWERYQNELKEWEIAVTRGSNAVLVGNTEKASPPEKPPMFAFCLKPRGLDVPKKRSKQRSKRKFSVSGYNHIVSERRSNRVALGDNKVVFPRNVAESSDALSSPQTTKRVLPRREAGRPGRFSLSNDMFEWDFRPKTCQKKTKKIQSFSPFNKQITASHSQRSAENQNGLPEGPNQDHQYFEGSHNLGVEPLDASSSAQHLRNMAELKRDKANRLFYQHLRNMAELKRDKANRLFYQADIFTNKAAAALLKIDVIKAAAENSKGNG